MSKKSKVDPLARHFTSKIDGKPNRGLQRNSRKPSLNLSHTEVDWLQSLPSYSRYFPGWSDWGGYLGEDFKSVNFSMKVFSEPLGVSCTLL